MVIATSTGAKCQSANKIEKEDGTGTGVGMQICEATSGEGNKRKHSTVFNISGNAIDISTLPPPRPGRPTGKMHQDPIMQEARKRARVLRNRAAAQLSREKKRHHLEQLEEENAELHEKNEELEERLSRAEESNKEMSARLDDLTRQLRGFESILLAAQKQQQQASLTPPLVDWTSVAASPLAATPLHTPPRSASQASISSVDPSFVYTNTVPIASPTSTTAIFPQTSSSSSADVSGTSLFSAMSGSTVTSSAILKPSSAALGLFPNVAMSSELSGKGLSESAALAQSGTHIYCVVSDSQQRRPLPHMESICRKLRLRQQSSAVAALETCTSISSSKSWGQRLVDMAVSTVLSASPQSSPQVLWTIFCTLFWILSQSGGWLSRHQVSRMARGILASPPRDTESFDGSLDKPFGTRSGSSSSSRDRGLASLAQLSAWLAPGSRTAAALRRVVGNEPVDNVRSLVSQLRSAAHTIHGSKHRIPSGSLASNKQHPLFYPP
ncbi:hypothetical protein H4S07_002792 [Coemansia furcata]|uniref:Uncharacterized protein n=1 Tax=Coemansia furcata TaxID=417177 RepID=A0ACC1LIL8_9FUNG|nr:hypothetical protein H4S07_002792 [Coemansia furcata]